MTHLKYANLFLIPLSALASLSIAAAQSLVASSKSPCHFTPPLDYYGKSIDVFRLFGQSSISETGRNLVTANAVYHAPGVLVDRSSPLDRTFIYVVDSGNNRVPEPVNVNETLRS